MGNCRVICVVKGLIFIRKCCVFSVDIGSISSSVDLVLFIAVLLMDPTEIYLSDSIWEASSSGMVRHCSMWVVTRRCQT